MSEESFTAEQVLLVLKSGGFDPSRPLTEQLRERESGSDVAELRARIEQLEQKLEGSDQPTEQAQPTDNEQMGRAILKGIQDVQTPWYSVGGTEGKDAA